MRRNHQVGHYAAAVFKELEELEQASSRYAVFQCGAPVRQDRLRHLQEGKKEAHVQGRVVEVDKKMRMAF